MEEQDLQFIPLSNKPFHGVLKPLVSKEALDFARKHGFCLHSDVDSPSIVLVSMKKDSLGRRYKVVVGNTLKYSEFVLGMADPFYSYYPENSLSDKAPYRYWERYLPVPEWVYEFKSLVDNQPYSKVVLDNLNYY